MMGGKEKDIIDVPCGNLCALIGVDDKISKQATIVGAGMKDAHNIRMMKYTVSPVVRVAVTPCHPRDLPKLVEGLGFLQKSDNLVLVKQDSITKQHVISGCGELHIDIMKKDLRNFYTNNI